MDIRPFKVQGQRKMRKRWLCPVCCLGCDVNKDEIIVLFKSQLLLPLTVSTVAVMTQPAHCKETWFSALAEAFL